MKFAKFAAAAAALSLASAPALAAPAPARASAPAASENDIGGQAGILVLFALLALIIGVAVSGGDDDAVSA
jgi:hypothetical protein